MFGLLLRAIRAKGLVPEISDTERAALEAGTVWVEGQLFSGKPDFRAILAERYDTVLDPREQAFLDGPVREMIRCVDRWQSWRDMRLPDEVFELMRTSGIFGMRISQEHGGLGFSAHGFSAVVGALSTHSVALGVVAMVPNSLGPGELLEHYGTPEQQRRWLPRLARGEEIPCFALTEPNAGSDAASISSHGVVFRAEDGALKLRLSWDKRYITLAPMATLLGLAFQLRDPDNLLGKGVEPGITCALVPTDTPGVVNGRRHDPLSIPFPVGPTQGTDVVVGLDAIIGGPEYAGRGWPMLMDCLSAGRGICLPAQSTGGVKLLSRVASAYATVREQFGLPIGRFEGIEEPLARIAGTAYLMDAARVFTCGAIDAGHKPSVVSAIVKWMHTEFSRVRAGDGMDIMAGAGICRGPRNMLAEGWTAAPIGITVEGANILTRTLIVFGQGAVRCHPFARAELEAISSGDVGAFRKAALGHAWWGFWNAVRLVRMELSRGRLAIPAHSGPAARYVRRLRWASVRFAVVADLSMALLGGGLKRMGRTTGRFADALGWMYLATSAIRRFEADGRPESDLPLLHYSCQTALHEVQQAFEQLLANIRVPLVGWLLRGPVRAWFRFNPVGRPVRDRLLRKVARAAMAPGPQRDRHCTHTCYDADPATPTGRLEQAFELALAAAPVRSTLRKLAKEGRISKGAPAEMARAAREIAAIEPAECQAVIDAEAARAEVVAVDDFSVAEYRGGDSAWSLPAVDGQQVS